MIENNDLLSEHDNNDEIPFNEYYAYNEYEKER